LSPRPTEAVDHHPEDEDAEPHGEHRDSEYPAVLVQVREHVGKDCEKLIAHHMPEKKDAVWPTAHES